MKAKIAKEEFRFNYTFTYFIASQFYNLGMRMDLFLLSYFLSKWKNEFKLGEWKSEYPNIDIRFGINSTGMRWKKEKYRNQQLLVNWTESESTIPGWPPIKGLVKTLQ